MSPIPASRRLPTLALALAGALSLGAGPCPAREIPDAATTTDSGATTVVVVRHAEKATDNPADRDPDLVEAGRARARALADVLAGAGLEAAYVTQYRRTRATAEPAASRFEAPVHERVCCNPDVATWADELAAEILDGHAGRSVLVVGHSNTVPEIVQALSGHHPGVMSESEYDDLFVIVVPAGGEKPRLFESRFGAASPAAEPARQP